MMKRVKLTVENVAHLSDERLMQYASCMNNPGVMSHKAVALARRRLRAMGVRYALVTGDGQEDDAYWTYASWVTLQAGDAAPSGTAVAIGVTPNHAAHILGGGCACRGWSEFNKW
jgi:hypothetical protein